MMVRFSPDLLRHTNNILKGSLMNGLQSITQWQTYFGNPSGEILGIVNAAQSIGSVISLPVVGLLSDKIGRRWTLFSGTVMIIVASAIQAASVQYGMFVFSRYMLYLQQF